MDVLISKKSGAKVYHKLTDSGETHCGKLNRQTREKSKPYSLEQQKHEYGDSVEIVSKKEAIKFGFSECHECFNDGYDKTLRGIKSEIEKNTGLSLSEGATTVKSDMAKISEWIDAHTENG